MLTTTITSPNQLMRLFSDYGRGDQFSRTGFILLFEYLVEVAGELPTDTRVDVVALCCDWTEYEDEDEAAEEYGMDEEELRENTIVLDTYAGGHSGTTVLVLNF